MTEKPHSPDPVSRFFRRVRRNRFWLLLYLWTAFLLPALVLCLACGGTHPLTGEGMICLPVLALAPSLTVFLVCTALRSPRANFAVSLCCTAGAFLFHAGQLVHHRAFGTFLSLHALAEPLGLTDGLFRSAVLRSLPAMAVMGLPLTVLTLLGRKLFSFRPLKHWQQHIPMIVACVLSHLLVLPWVSVIPEPVPPSEPPVTEQVLREPPSPVLLTDVPVQNRSEPDFTALAVGESRESVAQIHRYFAGRSPSEQNPKTGLFRDCNLIHIRAELSAYPVISREATPVLYRLFHEGLLFPRYYMPEWDADILAPLTGLIPAADTLPAENYMPLTMAQQLLSRGYRAWALHDNPEGDRYLEWLGYETASLPDGPLTEGLDPHLSDYVNSTPFTLFCDLRTPRDVSELDQTLRLLLTRLEYYGSQDSTVIVLTLDPPGGDDQPGICLIRKPGLTPEVTDTPCSELDLLPTLTNLFGFSFDSRLYMGRDLFSRDAPLVPFPDGSWITEIAAYDARTGKAELLIGAVPEDGYIGSVTREVQNRFSVSAGILQEDYWRILFP